MYEVVATHFLSAKSPIFIIVTTPKWRVCSYFASFLDLAKLPRVPLTVGIIQQCLTLMSLGLDIMGTRYYTEGTLVVVVVVVLAILLLMMVKIVLMLVICNDGIDR